MPTKFSSGNGYTNSNTTAKAITGSNDGFSDSALVSADDTSAYIDSFRGQVNNSYGTNNMRVMSQVNAAEFAKFANSADGLEIVSRYDMLEFHRIDLLTGAEIYRIGYHATQTGEFSAQMIVWLTEEVIRNDNAKLDSKTQLVLDGNFAYWAKRSPNGKYTPPVIKAVSHNFKKRKAYTRKAK